MSATKFEGIRVENTDIKGNHLVAVKKFEVGEEVLSETAVVAATWHEFRCLEGCEEAHKSSKCPKALKRYPSEWMSNIAEIESVLGEVPGIDELDRARTLIKCIYAFEAGDDIELQALVNKLSACNEERNMTAAHMIAKNPVTSPLVRKVKPEIVAHILGVLNTNCHELEDLGGSALFPTACLCEHSCAPTCSFSTQGSRISLVAITPIEPNDCITLDYGNFYYDPVMERLESLRSSYGFDCICDACTVLPDKTRSFRCPTQKEVSPFPGLPSADNQDARREWVLNWAISSAPDPLIADEKASEATSDEHIVCPIGLGDLSWKCSCGYELTKAEIEQYTEAEAEAASENIDTVRKVVNLLERGILTIEHYIIFRAMEHIATESLAGACAIDDLTSSEERQVLAKIGVWNWVLTAMNKVLPQWHHEKSVFLDYLAQAYVAFGMPDKASAAFGLAYEQSKVVCGAESSNTLQLKDMMENTPKSIDELMLAYNNIKDAAEMMHVQMEEDEIENESDLQPEGAPPKF